MIQEHSVVRLREAIPSANLQKGDVGTVVMVYPEPATYEVEFNDQSGLKLVALLTLSEDAIEVIPVQGG